MGLNLPLTSPENSVHLCNSITRSPPFDGEGGAPVARGSGGATNETLGVEHPHPQRLPARGRGDVRLSLATVAARPISRASRCAITCERAAPLGRAFAARTAGTGVGTCTTRFARTLHSVGHAEVSIYDVLIVLDFIWRAVGDLDAIIEHDHAIR